MRTKILILIAALSMIMVSCNATNRYIKQLEALSQELKLNSEEYTTEDWDAAFEKFDKITTKLSSCELTDEQRTEIGRLKGKCLVYFSKSTLRNAMKGFSDFAKEFQGAIDGVIEELNN